jgi:glycosyltransferase involved in cell wall biosynthesis
VHVTYVDRSGAHAIWRLMDSVASQLIASGHDVSYVRMDDGIQRRALAAPDGVEVCDIPVSPRSNKWDILKQQRTFGKLFSNWLKARSTDLVHTNFCLPGNVARRIAKGQFGIPVVTTCHEIYSSMNPLLRWGVRRTERNADAIVYISRTVACSYLSSFSADRECRSAPSLRHRLIYNGIDTESILRIVRSIPESDIRRARQATRLVSVGRLVPEKGHALVIQALPELLETHSDLEYHLLGEGPERARLTALATQLGVAGRVHLHGWVDFDEAIRQVAMATIVVMPSSSSQEGFGLALAEAMLCGVSIVASRIPVFEEVSGGESSSLLLFKQKDKSSLKKAISSLLKTALDDVQEREALVQRIEQRFSAFKMNQEYIDLYIDISQNQKPCVFEYPPIAVRKRSII